MIDLQGAIDVHVHAGPELFPRIGSSVEIARRAAAAGMRGMVFKCHHEGTVSRAESVRESVPEFEAWGGIVLNGFVGGINPIAVAAQLDLGARIVWMPTLHAKHHVSRVGAGTYGIPAMTVSSGATMLQGLTILDPDEALTAECIAVIDAVKEHDAVLATGHLGQAETAKLAEACNARGVRCLVTHVFFLGQTLEFLCSLAAMGAFLEISAAPFMPMAHYLFSGGPSLGDARTLVERVGAARIVISSDCGQLHNPWPSEALLSFVRCLEEVGVDEDALRQMLCETPASLIGGR